jgi:hypothetical protein
VKLCTGYSQHWQSPCSQIQPWCINIIEPSTKSPGVTPLQANRLCTSPPPSPILSTVASLTQQALHTFTLTLLTQIKSSRLKCPASRESSSFSESLTSFDYRL